MQNCCLASIGIRACSVSCLLLSLDARLLLILLSLFTRSLSSLQLPLKRLSDGRQSSRSWSAEVGSSCQRDGPEACPRGPRCRGVEASL